MPMNPGNAWRRAGDVACNRYLTRHSAYLDGELTAEERLVHEAHEASCASCARYASVLRRGASMLRDLPEIEPSSDFQQRLQHRIYHVQDEVVLAAERTRRMSWLAAAAGVALVAGGGLLVQFLGDRPPADTRTAAASAGLPANQLADSWTTPPVPLAMPSMPAPPVFAGYSPVVVRPPLYQPVSYELMAGE